MKLEIEFEIVEITRYKITRKHKKDGTNWSAGFSVGKEYGEFENRSDAEAVRDALEANLDARIAKLI